MFRTVVAILVAGMAAGAAWAGFSVNDDGKALTLLENEKPVLTYQYTRVDPPEGAPEHFWRMGYIHPLYGLDGEVLTEDFPLDHFHHRGLFWGWPKSMAGDKPMDIWAVAGARQIFEKWLDQDITDSYARIGVSSLWMLDDDPQPKVRENVYMTVYQADDKGRNIDFVLQFQNVCRQDVTFLGADNKGYGGFNFRPDATKKPFAFTTAKGPQPDGEDALEFQTPWADISYKQGENGPVAGVAMYQHPANPGYPHKGWIFRHYGFLGACWPHLETYTLAQGDYFELRYRLYVHRGSAEEAAVAERFAAFEAAEKEAQATP